MDNLGGTPASRWPWPRPRRHRRPGWYASTRKSCPLTADGTVLGPGSRRHYSPSSSIYRQYAAQMTRALAERYKDHPALALWHVDNELGCHVG